MVHDTYRMCKSRCLTVNPILWYRIAHVEVLNAPPALLLRRSNLLNNIFAVHKSARTRLEVSIYIFLRYLCPGTAVEPGFFVQVACIALPVRNMLGDVAESSYS